MNLNKTHVGMLYMMVSIIIHTCSDAFFRACLVDMHIPVAQMAFMRALSRCLIISVIITLFVHKNPFRSQYVPSHIIRVSFATVSMFMFSTANKYTQMTSVGIIGYLTPIFTVIIGAVFLSEKVSRYLIYTVLISFSGAYILFYAKSDLMQYGALFALAGSFCSAIDNILRRKIAIKDTPWNIMFYHNFISLVMSGIPMLMLEQWHYISIRLAILFFVVGICITLAQYLVTLAFQRCNASTLAPINFISIIPMTILDAVIWNHHLSLHSIIAASMVIGANVYYVYHAHKSAI